VQSENLKGDDVTQQYTDLTSQLTNLQAAEEQLRKIMDSAGKTDDVLAVYKELVNTRGQIEVIKGKLKYFDEAAAFSAIAITLTPSDDAQPLEIAGWQPDKTVRSAVSTLLQLLQGLADGLIWLVIVGLPFAILAFIGYVVYRRFRRFAPKPAPEPPEVA
jgi:hypothetical protein